MREPDPPGNHGRTPAHADAHSLASADPYAGTAASAARLAVLTQSDRHDVAVVLGSGWA